MTRLHKNPPYHHFRKKDLLFMVNLAVITCVSHIVSPTPSSILKIMGILFATSYLLFYSGDIAVYWYKLLAEKAMKRSDPDIVKELYRNIYRISPESLSGKAALAIVHTLEGKWNQAETLYREVLRIRPYDTRLQYNLAVTLVQKGEYEEALRSILLIINFHPKWAIAYSAAGEIHFALKNYEQAKLYFKAALLLDHEDQSALLHLPQINKVLQQTV